MIVYLDGKFIDRKKAKISVLDRGFLFGDAIYDVFSIYKGKFVDFKDHISRLKTNLTTIKIKHPFVNMSEEINDIARKLLQLNEKITSGYIYIQISRGAGDVRKHVFNEHMKPTVFIDLYPLPKDHDTLYDSAIKIKIIDEIRWHYTSIKSVNLLPNCWKRTQYQNLGYDEIWFAKGDIVVEGASSNAWIINDKEVLLTAPSNDSMLSGVTRKSIIKIARKMGLKLEERFFTKKEAYMAKEAFISASIMFIQGIGQIDDHTICGGKIGPITKNILSEYIRAIT